MALRDKALWRMLYETAARAHEILALDVADLDPANRKAKVRRKGGAADIVVWRTGTARLLPRLLNGRKTGPLFLTGRSTEMIKTSGNNVAPPEVEAVLLGLPGVRVGIFWQGSLDHKGDKIRSVPLARSASSGGW